MRLTPDFALPFVQLARLDRPIGWQLLLAPCWQATALAGLALHRGPNLWHLALFLVGAVAMRGAGCTYNDILDRKLDAEVERTRNRPLPAGRVTIGAAAAFLAAQALVGLAVLLCFNRFSIWLGIASLGVVAVYPLMKRVTSWPQAALGLAFSWGALMGWSATFASLAWPAVLLYFSAFAWTIGYDTIYALQDARDDAIVGIRSTARLFGARARLGVGLFYAASAALALAAIGLAGGGAVALAGWLAFSRPSRLAGAAGSKAPTLRPRSSSFAPTATRGSSCSPGSPCRGGWPSRPARPSGWQQSQSRRKPPPSRRKENPRISLPGNKLFQRVRLAAGRMGASLALKHHVRSSSLICAKAICRFLRLTATIIARPLVFRKFLFENHKIYIFGN